MRYPPTTGEASYHPAELAAYRALSDRTYGEAIAHAEQALAAYEAGGDAERAGRMCRLIAFLTEHGDGRRDVTPTAA